jgi:hypothetical protein
MKKVFFKQKDVFNKNVFEEDRESFLTKGQDIMAFFEKYKA